MATLNGGGIRVSIAMCTCNGARFLAEQLDSLRRQTHRPHELVVCDDASDDGTLDMLEEFARDSPFPVRIVSNRIRLGIVRNFDQAIGMCGGDVIALADQDDVWSGAKLERLVEALELSGAVAAFCDADIVDAELRPLGYSMWERVAFDGCERQRFARGGSVDVLLKHYVVMGAALAFRAELRERVLPVPESWPHDAWIALVAAACGNVVPVATPLLRYRQHGGNQVGGVKLPLLRQIRDGLAVDRNRYYVDEIARWKMLAVRIADVAPSAADKVRAKIRHLEARANLPAARWRRIPGVWRCFIDRGYARYARNWGSMALDLLIR